METDKLEDMPLTANAPVLFYSDRRELGLAIARGLEGVCFDLGIEECVFRSAPLQQ